MRADAPVRKGGEVVSEEAVGRGKLPVQATL